VARILLIDDEEHIRQYYQEELAEEGYEISTLSSGEGVLVNLDSLQPEAVVLDIRLVDYDGLELLQEIRSRHHDLPVILCSAYDSYKEDPKAMAADYYVIKSFDLRPLKAAIQKALETDRSMRVTACCGRNKERAASESRSAWGLRSPLPTVGGEQRKEGGARCPGAS
jgi:two-component system response regulator (stage 0 sporulation protein F)